MSTPPVAYDVGHLPRLVYGPRAPSWWGTIGFVVVEGLIFAICVASYFYLRRHLPDWPPGGTPLPDLVVPTVFLVVLLASLGVGHRLAKAAKRRDRAGVLRAFVVSTLFGVVLVTLRAFEYGALNTRWDTHAYGSLLWVTMSFHTLHLAIDTLETLAFTVLFYRGPLQEKHFGDADDSAFYWNFVVLSWVPLYVMIYLVPRVF